MRLVGGCIFTDNHKTSKVEQKSTASLTSSADLPRQAMLFDSSVSNGYLSLVAGTLDKRVTGDG